MKKLLLLLTTLFNVGCCGNLPDYDTRCNDMFANTATIDPYIYESQVDYFNKSVPKLIHQIWFGDKAKLKNELCHLWELYAEKFGFKYKLWSEEDLQVKPSFISSRNWNLLNKMLAQKNWWAASDILRYEILNEYGGVYIDCDFAPPHKDNAYLDMNLLFNFRGLTLVTENVGRNIKTSAIFVCNGFIISSPKHPIMASIVDQVHENAEHWYHRTKNYDASFVTGPFLLNKVISGSFNVVPITYLKKINCCQ